jgi:hypothetical protein
MTKMHEPKSLREQLAPIGAKLREGRAVIRPVSQVTLRLKPVANLDRFNLTIDEILRWINLRAGRKLPDIAWERKSFDLSDIGAQRTAAVAIDAPKYWAARLDDADKKVPLRTWVTEIGVGVDETNHILFGARLVCASRGEDLPFDRTIPGFVRSIVSRGAAQLDGEDLIATPRIVATESDVEWLVHLLEKPTRETDVIVFALPDGSTDIRQTIIPTDTFFAQTLGAVHVVIITGPASYLLTDRIGKELSVFWQGVRTYKPNFRSWVDEPSRHPLALAARINSWAPEGSPAFSRWLINQILANSVYVADREQRLPAFNTVRQFSAQIERDLLKRAGGSDTEMLRLYQEDNERLRNDLQEQKELHEGLLQVAEYEREAAQQEANAVKAQAFALRDRIRALEKELKEETGKSQTDIPSTLNGFENWCKQHLSGSVEVANRAFQGVRKSEYEDPQTIYKALLVLRDQYVPMRREGGPEKRRAYEEALAAIRLEESGTGDGIKFDSDLYSVQYGNRRMALDRHLKGGKSRDPRFCFRLYFFWDDETEVVVVGWLPSHLDNRMS